MIKIKITTQDSSFPLIRQTPGGVGIWRNCKFYINKEDIDYDYWVVFDDLPVKEISRCPKENLILFTGEPPSVRKYNRSFINQFSTVVSCQKGIKHKNLIISQPSQPWLVGVKYNFALKSWDNTFFKQYDNFFNNDLASSPKTKLLSVISSNKAFTKGHRLRLKFVLRLKEYFGESIDVFGRGFKEMTDKEIALNEYKYSIVIENSVYPHYWTEKLSDAFLCNTYPIYYGCPNIHDYFSSDSLTIIDIMDFDKSVKLIESLINKLCYEKSLAHIETSKKLILNDYNVFEIINKIVELDLKKGFKSNFDNCTLLPSNQFIISKLRSRVSFELNSILNTHK